MTKHPTLFHKARTGALHQWTVCADAGIIYTEHGIVGGQLQTSQRKAYPKNVGRTNATTSAKQAELEAAAMHTHQLTRKYSLNMEAAQEVVFLPMLAHDFEANKAKVSYPVDVQPKLDGVRCLAYWEEGHVVLTSRSGRLWSAPKHIIQELEHYLPAELVLDGELYVHGVPFEDLVSWAKKYKAGFTERLKLHVYDIVQDTNLSLDSPWTIRHERMETHFMSRGMLHGFETVDIVPTYAATAEASVYDRQRAFVEAGYEGAIVRLRMPGKLKTDTYYELGHRSRALLKVKTFQDAEYEITGYTHGEGKHSAAVIYICELRAGGPTFNVQPKATIEAREKLYKTGASAVGRMYKVKFFELTADFVPRFPVGLGFREAE